MIITTQSRPRVARAPLPARFCFLLLLALALVITGGSTGSADFLYLNEGEEVVGTLIRVQNETVIFQDLRGGRQTYKTADIAHILLSRIRQGDDIQQVASLTEPLLLKVLKTAPSRSDFPHADYTVLYQQRRYQFHIDGSVTHERRKIIKILREAGLGLANQSLYFLPEREKLHLAFAHTYAPDGRIYHLTDEALAEESLFSSTPEYDRVKRLKFSMKKVDVGAVIDLSYTLTSKSVEPLVPYLIESVFGQREPVLHEEVVVEFPPSRPLTILKRHWTARAETELQEHTVVGSETTRITWKFRDTKGFIPEQSMPSTGNLFPHLYIVPTLSLEHACNTLLHEIHLAGPATGSIRQFVAESGIASGAEPLVAAQTLYDSILRRIRLLGISFGGKGDYLPTPGEVALTKRYGNNFARICLLHSCLQALQIPGTFLLTGSWTDDGLFPEVPSIGQVQDVVLRIDTFGRPTYIWCGSDYLPFGHLPTFLQGAPAWELTGNGFKPLTLPEGGADFNRFDRSVFVTVAASGDMEVKDNRTYRGPYEVGYRGMRVYKNQDLHNIAQKSVKRVHSKAQLIDYAFSDLNDLNAPVLFSLNYRIPAAAIKASEQILAFKNYWVNYNSSSASLATRTYPMQYAQCEETTNFIQFQLPPGFSWVPWKNRFFHSSSLLEYTSSLKQTGNLLLYADVFKVKCKEFTPENYQQYRSCLGKMGELSNQWIILEALPTLTPPPQTAPKP
jgi:hypothetical protein